MAKGFGNGLQYVWDLAEQAAILSDGEIVTGIAQHPIIKRSAGRARLVCMGADVTACST